MSTSLFNRSALALAGLALGASTAFAQPVGSLNISGGVRVTASGGNIFLDFLPAGGGTGLVSANLFAQTGSFTSVAGATGTMTDFTPTVGMNMVSPLLTIGGFTFDLEQVFAGIRGSAGCVGAPTTGQNCTPTGTAFNLTNLTPNSSTASFRVAGTVMDGTGMSDFTGTFTTQFDNLSFQEVIAQATSAGGVETTFSASFTAAVVPEPSTYALLGTGLFALAGVARRRRA